ncbi:hypothetical protein PLCT2_02067 [Planctomycetaceae bacterium]|nr:hypothetical protein PLCT2_02067 [Planctomycetaceae bacterium]
MFIRRVFLAVTLALVSLFASGVAAQSVVQAGAPAQVPAGNCSQGQLDYVALGFGASVITGGATNLTSVTVSNTGTALPADWVRIRLVREVTINTTVDGTDVIVGSVNSTTFPITFSGLSNQIPATPGAAVYLLAIDVAGAGTSTVGRTFTLNVTAMTATAAVVNGLPINGNAQTIVAPSLCEIDVQRNSTSIPTGNTDAVGNRATGAAFNLTYTILNTGSAALNLTGTPAINIPSISVTNCTASVTATPTTPVAAAGSTTFTIQCTPSAAGPFGFGIRIDNNDSNENPYNIIVSGTGVTPAPEMDITRGAVTITDNNSDALGSVPSGAAQNVTYTITNSGTATLNLTGTTLVVVTPVTNVTSATVSVQPTSTVAASASTTFTVAYTVTGSGAFTFSISIDNNDASENPYNWNVTGTGAGAVPELDVSRGATPIASGGTDAAGTFTAGILSPISYTLANSGSATLNISAAGATPGANCMVTVATAAPPTIAAGNSAPFVIDVTPVAAGNFDFTITILSDDPNEATYTITVTGVATTGTGGGGGGGSGSGGGGCTTAEDGAWQVLVAALCALTFAIRARRKRA